MVLICYMFGYQPSIRSKITMGYYGVVALIAGLSIFTFTELAYLERKIVFENVITEFFDATLEIRRFEKNYFLYGKEADYHENLNYVREAQELLETNINGFIGVSGSQLTAQLREDLKKYRELFDQYAGGAGSRSAAQAAMFEAKIRETGKHIITVAEEMSKTERRNLQRILNHSQNILIFSIVFLSILVIGLGQVLTRIIVRPLKLIEKNMGMIAEGRFETIDIDSRDREITSLTNAFAKMLKELEMRQRHLIQSEKLASLGTLLSGVAHELNNPLSNISSSCQILSEEIEDSHLDYKKELIAQIDEQTDRARNIVRSLLEFSRDKDFKKETVPLKQLIEETVRFVKGQVPAQVGIVQDIPGDISVFADKQRLQQAFLNLMKNAVQAISEEGSVLISARKIFGEETMDFVNSVLLEECQYNVVGNDEGSSVYIKVVDSGTGIPKDVLPRIFDPFFSTKDVGQGSGLGLFIVHEIIQEHGGCIAVDSAPGKGTTFLIRLPATAGNVKQ
jgi:two-component system NtrC family sensor kinase